MNASVFKEKISHVDYHSGNWSDTKLIAKTTLYQCDACQVPSTLLAPLDFLQPWTPSILQAVLPAWRNLWRLGSPYAYRSSHFPFICTSTSSVKSGSQEVMWELNTRRGYNTIESIQRPGCLFFGNKATLQNSLNPVSLKTKIKINQRQPEKKRDKMVCLHVQVLAQT